MPAERRISLCEFADLYRLQNIHEDQDSARARALVK